MHITGNMYSNLISAIGCFAVSLFLVTSGIIILKKNDNTLYPFLIFCFSFGSIFGIICIILVKELLAKFTS